MMASMLRACAVALLTMVLAASSVAATNHGDAADADGSTPSTEKLAEQPDQPDEQDPPEAGSLEACWENIEPAPFVDTDDLSAESAAAIDCVYHYGIVRGTSAYAYSPAAPVIRLHMALFLVRTARVLGLPVAQGATASFDDLGGVSNEARAAVAQLKQSGVTQGYSPTVFGPDNVVERVHMAHFLVRLLKLTSTALPVPAEQPFEDVATLSAAARRDISVLAELEVMDPAAPGRFDPHAPVTRHDMALFLARILEVADVDPVTLELSLSTNSLLVGGAATATVRASKPDGSPYAGLLIDVFADQGWRNRSCNLDFDARLNGSDAGTSENCRIDIGDPRTDSDGEVTVGLAHSAESADNTIFAWAGTLGQVFDEREVTTEVKKKIDWQPVPTRVKVPEPFGVAFGESFSIVVRLEGPNSAARRMVLVSSYDGLMRVVRVETTNDEGEVAFSVPALANPDPGLFRPIPVDETILVFWDRNANGIHDGPAELSSETTIYWS